MDELRAYEIWSGPGLVQLVGGAITAIVAFVFLVLIDPVMTYWRLSLAAFAFVSFRALKTLRPAFRDVVKSEQK
ncbi:MAG: hypothetical protein CM1200mP14_08120 [Gammaproteobacteria bacterium]|nr:MAG: hypothetical protein CM1200mP14_08120 [Gammaproteobacteria bacterium]